MDEEQKKRNRFERIIRNLTRNPRVIAALLKCYDEKNFVRRKDLGLYPSDRKEFDTALDWVMKAGLLP